MSEKFQGIGVSRGVAVGRATLRSTQLPVVPTPIPPERVDREVDRFHKAREEAREDLKRLQAKLEASLGEAYAGILKVQLWILDDDRLVEETVQRIRMGRHSAEWALKEVVNNLQRSFAAVEDPYLRERVGDLEDLHRRLQRALRGQSSHFEPNGTPSILVTDSLGPSEAVALEGTNIAGLATDGGGRTSHTAILAQAMGIPCVVGLHDLSQRLRPGDALILDGESGKVIIQPSLEELSRAKNRIERWEAREEALREASHLPTITQDGTPIALQANLELPQEVQLAADYGAAGIGLYRSEFLFLAHSPALPSEEDHYQTYRKLLEAFPEHPVTVRTLDLGGEKYFHEVLEGNEQNPVLGLRAIRFCLRRPDILRTQLRGALRASVHGQLKLMVPLVSQLDELRIVRKLLNEERQKLQAEGIMVAENIALGTMIEVPAAAIAADLFAAEADFFSIGTNDLIQYALAVDRSNDSVSELYQPLHPAVLRMLKTVLEAGAKAGIPVSVCGEMAGEPEFVPLLIGLGLRSFSVQTGALGPVREAIRRSERTRAQALAEAALRASTAREIASLLKNESTEIEREN